MQQVVKRYADGEEVVRAVDGLDLTIGAGEMSALYGPSGSGKTTLLLLAAGLLAPDAGAIRVDGQDVGELRASELSQLQRAAIGFIYQSPHLMNGVPAVENAAVKLLADGVSLKDARPRAADWLERVGLGNRLGHTPEHLSGGERQRVAIARALVSSPRLVLADEPTGNLDTRRGREVLELLAGLATEQGAAVLLATHDHQAAEIADRVLALRDGKLLHGAAAAEEHPALIPALETRRRRG